MHSVECTLEFTVYVLRTYVLCGLSYPSESEARLRG